MFPLKKRKQQQKEEKNCLTSVTRFAKISPIGQKFKSIIRKNIKRRTKDRANMKEDQDNNMKIIPNNKMNKQKFNKKSTQRS